MVNLSLILYFLFIVLIIFSIYKLKLSLIKFLFLVVSPVFLFGLFALYENSIHIAFLIAMYGMFVMFPALLVYAFVVLFIVNKRYLNYWKIFLLGGIVGGIVGFIYGLIITEVFLRAVSLMILPSITGAFSALIVEYISNKKLEKG